MVYSDLLAFALPKTIRFSFLMVQHRGMRRRRRAMKKSVIARGRRAKAMVYFQRPWWRPYAKTAGGKKKGDLTKNKAGKIVSKAASAAGKVAYRNIAAWGRSIAKGRNALGLKGFVAVNGQSPEGKVLYAKAKAFLAMENDSAAGSPLRVRLGKNLKARVCELV
jgi:hypothetical protein